MTVPAGPGCRLRRAEPHDLDFLVALAEHEDLEPYDFNERGIRQAERAGFVREGVKRRAYWRHGRWTDGILFGLVREDLEER